MNNSKLVRDKIVELIQAQGKNPTHHTASPEEFTQKLKEKLQEEVAEFIQDSNNEELADILEVIHELTRLNNISLHELEQLREKKHTERGGFEKRIILETD